MTIRLLIADDQALVRAGFRMILDAEDDLEVVGEAADGAEAVELARALRPDVVLMDIRMPQLDGIEATRRVIALDGPSPVRVLMLTTFDLNEYVYEALRAGASGFLLKDVPPEQLAAGIRVVQEGITNALKYADSAPTEVRVRWGARELELEILDRGPGPARERLETAAGGGHGLVGMRERVKLYGGELEAGRRRGGGFRIRAKLPLVADETTVEAAA